MACRGSGVRVSLAPSRSKPPAYGGLGPSEQKPDLHQIKNTVLIGHPFVLSDEAITAAQCSILKYYKKYIKVKAIALELHLNKFGS